MHQLTYPTFLCMFNEIVLIIIWAIYGPEYGHPEINFSLYWQSRTNMFLYGRETIRGEKKF